MRNNTVRVDIIKGKMDRTMPVSLQSYMNPRDWVHLANEMDSALAPALRLQTSKFIAIPVWFFISVIITFALFSSSSSGSAVLLIVIVPFLFVLMLVCFVVSPRRVSETVQRETSDICQRFTQQFTGTLSFHFKEEVYMSRVGSGDTSTAARYYLEIVLADTNSSNPPAVASGVEVLPYSTVPTRLAYETTDLESAPLPSAPVQDSAADRLVELERLKYLLTEKEYQDKRRRILDSV